VSVAGGRSVFTEGGLGKNSVINLKILRYFKLTGYFWLVFVKGFGLSFGELDPCAVAGTKVFEQT